MSAVSTIKVGDIIRTNYGTGPYEVVQVTGPYYSPSYVDELKYGWENAPRSLPHFSYQCRRAYTKEKPVYLLNGYDGVTHHSVWNSDRIITQEEDQLPLLIILM